VHGENPEIPKCFSFALTTAEGHRTYTTCLVFDEPIDPVLSKSLPPFLNLKWVQKAICLSSRYHYFDQFKQILACLYRVHLSQKLTVPLERFIQYVVDFLPRPALPQIESISPAQDRIQIDLVQSRIDFEAQYSQFEPFASKQAISNLLKTLSPENIIQVHMKLCLERKLIFVSKHKALLMQTIASFIAFLFPLRWEHTLVPLLSGAMIDVLDAPLPFIVGLEWDIFREYADLSEPQQLGDLTVVFLDQNRVQ